MIPLGILTQQTYGGEFISVPWTPEYIDTALWLDADDVSTFSLSGTSITAWRDKSGNARHADTLYGSSPQYIVSQINGKPIVRVNGFNGFNMTGKMPAVLAVNVRTVYSKPTAGGDQYQRVYSSDGGVSADYLDDGIYLLPEFGGNGTTAGGPAMTAGSGETKVTNNFTRFGIGYLSQVPGENAFRGDIGEIVIPSPKPSVADLEKLEGYLAHKWDLTADLAPEHPYKTDPPTHLIPGIPEFAPTDIPGLQTWLDGSDPGSTSNVWADKSGSGRGDWVKHPSYNMPPLNSPSYYPGVAYFANSHVINGPSYADMTEGEIFVRMMSLGTSEGLWYFSNKSDNGDWYPTGSNAYLGWGQNTRPSFSIGTAFDAMHTLNIYSKTNDWAAIVNESVRATDTSTVVGFVSAPYIGKMQAANYFLYGFIKEICIFDRKLTDEERTQMNEYMAPTTLRDKVKEIPGIMLLLDSTEPGNTPNQWSDLSGLDNHFVASPGTMPTQSAEGMYFNGTTDYLNGPDFSSLTGGEMLIEMKNDTPLSSPGVVWFGTNTALGNHHPYTPGNAFYDGFGSTARKGGFGSAQTGLVTSWHTTHYRSFASDYQMLINGISLYSSGNTVSFSSVPQIGTGLGRYFGWMKGIAFFKRKITTTERAVVQAWLDSL